MAVGDYVLDGHKPPPILARALNYDKWGIPDIMKLPAGELSMYNVALNYFNALKGYQGSAGNTANWSRKNKAAWRMVGYVLEQRMERA